MNLVDAGIDCMRQIAKNDGGGKGIDAHWEAVLPETDDIMANENFLALHHHYINDLLKREAAQVAQTCPPREIGNLADATLVLHCLVRGIWLGIAYDSKFQKFVNGNVTGVIHTVQGVRCQPNPNVWVRSSGLWLPLFVGTDRKIFYSVVEQHRQYYFAQHCWEELRRRHPARNNIVKYTFVLLTDGDELRQQRNEGIQWLRHESRRLALDLDPEVSEDAMQDWLEKLSSLPLHMQVQKVGATRKAIRQRAIDMQRKGGECKPVSLDEEKAFVNSMADESTGVESEELIDKEFLQLLSANQPMIEEILHRNAKIAKRRFSVMQMLAREPHLTWVEIARQLDTSPQTIGLDRDAIKDKWPLIQEAIYS